MQQGQNINPVSSNAMNVGGVDTHKDHHVAAVISPVGTLIATESFRNDQPGHHRLADWLATHGRLQRVGVEGTGSYGAELARHLRRSGLTVIEVNRPNRQRRRRHGKNDTVDAVSAAMAVLSGDATGTPKTADGPVESLRLVGLARRSAIKARTQAINQFQAVLDTAASAVREDLAGLSPAKSVEQVTRWQTGDVRDPDQGTRWVLIRLARRIQHLDTEVAECDAAQRQLVAATSAGQQLLARTGVGPVQRRPCCARPGTTRIGCAAKRRSPRCAGSPRWRRPPGAAPGTGSILVGTDGRTTRCGGS